MPNSAESRLSALERRRLRLARQNGYLDATLPAGNNLLKAYGLWCWRLKIPMVWCVSSKPGERYLRLHLDMLTTPNGLTHTGQMAMRELGASAVSAHEATWDRIPRAQREHLATGVFRAAVTPENYRRTQGALVRKLQLVPKRQKRAAGE